MQHAGWRISYPGGSSWNMHRPHDGPGPAGMELAGPEESVIFDWGVEFGQVVSNPPNVSMLTRKPRRIVLTHSHLDHLGGLASLMNDGYIDKDCRILGTPQTIQILPIALDDMFSHGEACYMDITQILQQCQTIDRPGVTELVGGATMYNASAGHIPGAMYSSIKLPNGYVGFVAGDIGWHRQRVIQGTLFPDDLPDEYLPDAIWWIDLTNPLLTRAEWEPPARRMVETVGAALNQGKMVGIYAFGNSRSQNVVLRLLEERITPIYIAGMIPDIFRVYADYHWCPQDVDIPRPLRGVRIIQNRDHFQKLVKRGGPLCIVTTSGMGDHGYAVSCIREGLEDPNWLHMATSWVDPRSPMGRILKAARNGERTVWLRDSDTGEEREAHIRSQVEQAHLSAHGTLGDWTAALEKLMQRRKAVFGHDRQLLDTIALTHGTQQAKVLAEATLRRFTRRIVYGNIGASIELAA